MHVELASLDTFRAYSVFERGNGMNPPRFYPYPNGAGLKVNTFKQNSGAYDITSFNREVCRSQNTSISRRIISSKVPRRSMTRAAPEVSINIDAGRFMEL